MSSNNPKSLTELSCEELVAVLRGENLSNKILTFVAENEVTGRDFAHTYFVDENILIDEVQSSLKLLPSQVLNLRDVHKSLLEAAAFSPSLSSTTSANATASVASGPAADEKNDDADDASYSTSAFSPPKRSTLDALSVEIDKFPELSDATQDKLKTAAGVLEGLKKKRGYVGSFFSIVHSVVSGIHNANGGAKKDCLQLIARLNRIVAGPNANFIFNPPRTYVPLFKEVLNIAKKAKLLIAKFIPVTEEDKTFFSNVQRAAALFTGCKSDFKAIHNDIDRINIDISSVMSTTSVSLQYGNNISNSINNLRSRARNVSDMKNLISELQDSCQKWYNENLKLELASKFASKELIELEELYIDLKIQHRVDATKIAENAAGEHADVSNLHTHLFKKRKDETRSKLVLIEGPAGCGKTTCCQEFTRRQTIEGAIVIFVALKDLFGCGRMTSIEDILSFVSVPPCVTGDGSLPEILKYDIPIVWILDGFDEVMLTDDGSVQSFLKNFVDPATRKKNIENKVLPDLVRPCDAVILSSRENRVDSKNVVVLNNLDSSLAPDFWIIQRWQRDAISKYVHRHFEKAGKPLPDDELKRIVDVTLGPQMQGFHGIPLFIKLLCDTKLVSVLENSEFDVSRVTPPFLYQKSLRQAFDRADIRISYVLNQDASWMKYETDRDKLFHDIVLQNASEQALKEFLAHQGTALTFTVPENEPLPLWLSVMLEMGVLQRDKQSDNSFKFPHRTFIEFLAAKRIALNPETVFSRLPFKDELNTTWLLLCQIANERDKDGFLDKLLSKGVTSKRLATLVAKRFVAEYLEIPEEERHTNDESKISIFVSDLSLKLLIQIAVALSEDSLINEIISAHDGLIVINPPSHLKWMIEWCGVFGAIKVLQWIDKKFTSVVNAEKFPKDLEERNRVRARCRLGLARALQARGANSSSLVDECVDFYLPRAGDLDAEDAIAADSHSALQQVLKERPWQGNVARLSKLVLTCISKRKSHPNLLASLLSFLQLDEDTDKKKCMPFLQLALFFAPDEVEIQNEDKSVEIARFAEKVKETQQWTQTPFFTEIFAEEELMKELLKNDSNITDAFKECSEIEVDDDFVPAGNDFVTWKPRPDTLLSISAREFLHHGFARLKYGGDVSPYILPSLDKVSITLKSLDLRLCAKEICDASLAALLPKYSSSLQTLALQYCDITDSGLQYLVKLSSLQSLNLHHCKKITDAGLQHLAKLPSLQSLNVSWCGKITDSGLQHLTKLTSLQSLNLCNCFQITNSCLQHLAKLSSLQSLNLRECDQITDSGLEHLAKLRSLQSLTLTKCIKITDRGLQHLVSLSSLQSLNLGSCDKITDSGLECLAKLTSLQSLNLQSCDKITYSGLRDLAKLTSLESLNLQSCDKITDSGLRDLAKLTSLESLNLRSCDRITDSGLECLAKLSSLQSLTLTKCINIADRGLQHLVSLSSLQTLDLQFCNKITDNGLEHVAKLPSLQTLNIQNCNLITDSGLHHLVKLSSLQSLDLLFCDKVTDNGLEHLAKLRSLQTLDLQGCYKITDSGLQHLAKLTSLQSLNIQNCNLITDSGLHHLVKLSSLQSLNVSWYGKITDNGLEHLAKLRSLQTLDLQGCYKITNSCLQHLAKLSSLQSLNLRECDQITDGGLEHLAKLRSLQTLDLQGCYKITDSGLQHLAKLTSLQTLNIQNCNLITDSGLHHLVKLSSLQSLNLQNCSSITDSGLQHLAQLSLLQLLNLRRCGKITNNGLQHLAKLASLQSLNLQSCDKITDSGLEHLAKLSYLQSLNLRFCTSINDGGLQHLAKLPSLLSLDLVECKWITDIGLQHLKTKLPSTHIELQ